MRYFYDAEFTDLAKDAGLISIGIVSEDGAEIYIELADGWTPAACSEWVHENVLPLIGHGEQLRRVPAAQRILDWLIDQAGEHGECELFADSTWDQFFLRPLLALATPKVRGVPLQFLTLPAGDDSGDNRHHALEDARALRATWIARHAH